MPIQIETRANHLHVHWSGNVTQSDLADLLRQLPLVAARCGFVPHILHTFAPAADLKLESIEVFNYTRERIRTPIPAPVRAAFVAHTPAGVAIARNFENFNRNPNLTLRSFVSENDALAWLVGDLRQDRAVIGAGGHRAAGALAAAARAGRSS